MKEKSMFDMTFDEFLDVIRNSKIDRDDWDDFDWMIDKLENDALVYVGDCNAWSVSGAFGELEMTSDKYAIGTIDEGANTTIKTFVLIVDSETGEVFSGEMVKAKMKRMKGKNDDLDEVDVLYKRLRPEIDLYKRLGMLFEQYKQEQNETKE